MPRAHGPSLVLRPGETPFGRRGTSNFEREELVSFALRRSARSFARQVGGRTQSCEERGALVWLEGFGRTDASGPFLNANIMAALFTSDPGSLQPRRLRSEDGTGMGVSPFVVGCGHAARKATTGIRLVRLTDGQAWFFASSNTDKWQWIELVAITCNELFVSAHIAKPPFGHYNLAPVRLDSLGPGLRGARPRPHRSRCSFRPPGTVLSRLRWRSA